jgi:hypothetical protein
MAATTAIARELFRPWHDPHPDFLRGQEVAQHHIQTKQRPRAEVADAWSSPEPPGTRMVLTP